MYALVKFNDSIEMVIGISEESAAVNLNQLVKFFEENVVCIKTDYAAKDIIKPEVTFHLGNMYVSKSDCWRESNEFAVVVEGKHNLDESFVINTPETYVSAKEAINKASKARKEAEEKLEVEVIQNKHLKEKVAKLKDILAMYTEGSDEDNEYHSERG